MWVCLRHTERRGIRTATKFAGPSPGHSESVFCSSVTKVTELMLLQTSHSPLTITVETLCPSIADEKHTVDCRQNMLTCYCSPSLPACCVCSMMEGLHVLFFWKNRYVIEKIWKLHPNVEVCPFHIKKWISFNNKWNGLSHFIYFSFTFHLILVVAIQIKWKVNEK